MPANVESMFFVREVPWHGLGINVSEALNSEQALQLGGLDWDVVQEPMFIGAGVNQRPAENIFANIRSTDKSTLGYVTERYQIVQNKEAFQFTDLLVGNGEVEVKYETAGSLAGGKRVWMLARLPEIMLVKDRTSIYLLFSTSHDSSTGIIGLITPVRVVCQNTLNLAVAGAQRKWSIRHTGNIQGKLEEARKTLEIASVYTKQLQTDANELANQIIDKALFEEFMEKLLPIPTATGEEKLRKEVNVLRQREELLMRYCYAPDIREYRGTAWGVINAVSDYATHSEPSRKTTNWKENRFINTVEGNNMIDKAYDILRELATV